MPRTVSGGIDALKDLEKTVLESGAEPDIGAKLKDIRNRTSRSRLQEV
jgi:hypothetical protein